VIRKIGFVVGLASFLLLSIGVGLSVADDKATATEGKAAPELVVSGWKNSKELKLADLKGKVVVLKFWATWCPNCKSSLPKFKQLAEAKKDKVVFIAVHAQKDAATMSDFMDRNKFTFIGCLDDKGETSKIYGAKQIPYNVLIDKKGNVKKLDADLDEKAIDKLASE
jgi:cytochrome c biogenesis protein CcmG/thiol:disulfide interchange protein DsbE